MIRLAMLAASLALGLAGPAAAQSYPDKPIKLITPFPPGGPVDVMARFVAQQLSASVGQVIVDNRPGAGGTIGAKFAAGAAPDGYTLLLGSSTTLAAATALYKNIGYDPAKSFEPIALISSVPFALAVAPSLPVKNVAELVAYAKAHPGKLNYGAPTGALPHLTAEMFKMFAGIDIVHIPYKGAANAITDMLSGQIDLAFEPTSVLIAHIEDGKVRGLATTGKTRSAQLPDLPTMIESGYRGLRIGVMVGPCGARRHAGCDRRQAQRRDQRQPERSGYQGDARQARRRPARRIAAGLRCAHRRGNAAMGRCGQSRGRAGRLNTGRAQCAASRKSLGLDAK